MKPVTNIVLLVAVAVGAVAAERMWIGPRVAANTESPSSLEGQVLAVDPLQSDGTPSLARMATIKLRGGEIVRASVGGCVISTGQTTRVSRMGSGREAVYLVAENGK